MSSVIHPCRSVVAFALAMIAAMAPALSDTFGDRRVTVIHVGQLLAVPGKSPSTNVTVVVSGSRIDAIIDGFVMPDDLPGDYRFVDLKDQFMLPGLVDAHVHLGSQGEPDPLLVGDAERAVKIIVHAKKTLLAGFTTVRDVGSVGGAIFAVRDAIKEHEVAGPRIVAAGAALSVTGGHGDETGYRELLWPIVASSGICDGADGCRKAVRTQVKRGADVIKLTASGGGGKPQGDQESAPEFYDFELDAIVDMAHRLDRKVAAHAHGTASINAALRAGVDSIEHGTFLDDESVRLFKSAGAFLVPTLSVRDRIRAELDTLLPPFRERAQNILDLTPAMMQTAKRGGVPVALGSDAGVVPHGQNARELEWLVDVGYSEAEALQAGTVNAARLLGLDDEIGTAEVGKLADLIATRGDPLSDIGELRDVIFVMRAGRVYKSQSD